MTDKANQVLKRLSRQLHRADNGISGDYNEGRHDAYLIAIYAVADEFDLDPYEAIENGKEVSQ